MMIKFATNFFLLIIAKLIFNEQMLSLLSALFYLLSFVIIVSVIVFIHEFGHYFASKMFGVHVVEFSIGFGKNLFSFEDTSGTKWKFGIIPMGGYVMNFGDETASSAPSKNIEEMSEDDKKKSMFAKKPWQKIIIALAGPLANFVSAWLFLVVILTLYGHLTIAPVISKIQPDSPAEHAGLLIGDRIISVDGEIINSFSEVQRIVGIALKEHVVLEIDREDRTMHIDVYPQIVTRESEFGSNFNVSFLGIAAGEAQFNRLNIVDASIHSFHDCVGMISTAYIAIKQIFMGKRSIKEMGGPIQIANHAGKAVKQGFWPVIFLIVLISINLGFVNLLPIPSLDGSHILFYTIEMFCTKLGRAQLLKIQTISFRIGMGFLIALSLVISFNDVKILISKIFH